MGDDDADGDDTPEEEESLIASDGESHDLKVPCMGHIHYVQCGWIFRCLLWALTLSFQAVPVCWIVLMTFFYVQSPSFITWLLNSGVGMCGVFEVIFSWVITFLAIVQLLQRGRYYFLHRSRVVFNVVLAAFISHLIVFFLLSFAVMTNLPGRMKKEMKRELNAYRRRGHDLHELWEMSQEKYSCCGFGSDVDYDNYPPTCCPQLVVHCTKEGRWKGDCYEAEALAGKYVIKIGCILLGVSIPYAALFYMGFRYFRPYWNIERRSTTALEIQMAAIAAFGEDEQGKNEVIKLDSGIENF